MTPHVTADGSVLLKIKATNNQPNFTLTGANGQPSITQEGGGDPGAGADGDTTVIGGIYTRKTAENLRAGAVLPTSRSSAGSSRATSGPTTGPSC